MRRVNKGCKKKRRTLGSINIGEVFSWGSETSVYVKIDEGYFEFNLSTVTDLHNHKDDTFVNVYPNATYDLGEAQ